MSLRDTYQKDKLQTFFNALHEDGGADISEIRKDLSSAGVNMGKIESSVSAIVEDAKRRKKKGKYPLTTSRN